MSLEADTVAAVAAERARCLAIADAGVTKAASAVVALMRCPAVDVDTARAVLDALPDERLHPTLVEQLARIRWDQNPDRPTRRTT